MASKTYYGSDDLYPVGLTLEITSHCPPPPLYGHPSRDENWPSPLPPTPTPADDLEEYCFQHLPIETTSPNVQQKRRIKIIKQLVPYDHDRAQLFVCELEDQGETAEALVVAKIYDPMYYCWTEDGNHFFFNVVLDADRDYSREAAAYEHLNQFSDNNAPKYYGSWTFSMTEGLNKTRPVRLILTEYIPAPSLYQAYYRKRGYSYAEPNHRTDIPEAFRLEVLRLLLETWSKQMYLGVNQSDIAPRNVIVLFEDLDEHKKEPKIKRLVLVDYGSATVFSKALKSGYEPPSRPENPLQLVWDHWISEFDGWVPSAWFNDTELYREWLYENFGTPEQLRKYELEPEFLDKLEDWLETRGLKGLYDGPSNSCQQPDISDPEDHESAGKLHKGLEDFDIDDDHDEEDNDEMTCSKETEDKSSIRADEYSLKQSMPLR